ncbi:MAG: MBL fold metallo-hydrolase [Gammaproteobacteria bacterium]|nr:MBL fold metallo-hydrolase [Gammaproteobacteria bacterium]
MLKIASIGSGSSGNATVVQSGRTTLLLDCGFTAKETVARMANLGLTPSELDGILISHEHGDHVRGAGPLSRKFGLPVWLTHGTYQRLRDKRFAHTHVFHAHERFSIGDVELDPFPTPHDAAESCQFVFESQGVRFACVTDLGVCTPHVFEKIRHVNGLIIECNYDTEMLRNGPYPPSLQARIQSEFGHLGNDQAAVVIKKLDRPELQHILLGHLSEQNNSDAKALVSIQNAIGFSKDRVTVLQQHCASAWFQLCADADSTTEAQTPAELSTESTLSMA